MTLQITYLMFSLISGLGVADKELSNKVRILFGVVCVIGLAGFGFVRLNL